MVLTPAQVRRLPQEDKLLYRRFRLVVNHVARTKRYPLEARYAARRIIGNNYDADDFDWGDLGIVIVAVLVARARDEKCGRYTQPVDVVVAAYYLNDFIMAARTSTPKRYVN